MKPNGFFMHADSLFLNGVVIVVSSICWHLLPGRCQAITVSIVYVLCALSPSSNDMTTRVDRYVRRMIRDNSVHGEDEVIPSSI